MIGFPIHLPLVKFTIHHSPFTIRYCGLFTPWHALPGENNATVHCTRLKCYEKRNARGTANDYTRTVVAIFRWAAKEEFVPGSIVPSLEAVRRHTDCADDGYRGLSCDVTGAGSVSRACVGPPVPRGSQGTGRELAT